jgi:hypothetical protein
MLMTMRHHLMYRGSLKFDFGCFAPARNDPVWPPVFGKSTVKAMAALENEYQG